MTGAHRSEAWLLPQVGPHILVTPKTAMQDHLQAELDQIFSKFRREKAA